MSDLKKIIIDSDDTADLSRRRALARLGLTAAAAYAAPTLLSLTGVKAKDGGDDSGGDSSGGDDSNSGGGNSSPSSGNSASSASGTEDGLDGNEDRLTDEATPPTSPSSSDDSDT